MKLKLFLLPATMLGGSFLSYADDITVTDHTGSAFTHDIGGRYEGHQVIEQNNLNPSGNVSLNQTLSETHNYPITFTAASGSASLSASSGNSFSSTSRIYQVVQSLDNTIDLNISGNNQFYYSQANTTDRLFFSTLTGAKLDFNWSNTADTNFFDSYLYLVSDNGNTYTDVRLGQTSGSRSFVLGPGDYQLFSGLDTSLGSDTRFGGDHSLQTSISGSMNYTAEFAPVPEPASLLVIGAGITGLLRRRNQG